MDRRQKKSRNAILNAFITLLSKKEFDKITVEQIIQIADVGRATFYAHFETKDFLLKELCHELFAHVFESDLKLKSSHKHVFSCDAPDSVFLHLFKHFENNDNHISTLLTSQNNHLFLNYFKNNLEGLINTHLSLFEYKKPQSIPNEFWVNHIESTFIETLRWWLKNGKQQTPEQITDYFITIV